MAIYHCSVKVIGRSSGRSAVGSAAYRAGEKLENERDGVTHDYTHKGGVEHTEIMTPENAPDWTKDRGTLWNEVEKVEKRKDAQTAREVEVALPNELDREQQKELLRDYVKETFNDQGMIADVAIHDKGDGNPHAHILLTTREIGEDGKFGNKNREWNHPSNAEKWREKWAEIGNRHLERAGHEPTLDHRSYERQGIEKVPTVHLGPEVAAMEKRGFETDRGNINREIKEQNRQLDLIARREPLLEKQKENLLEELKQITIEQPKPYLTTVPEQKPEPEKEPLSLNTEKVKIRDLLHEAWDYRKSLEQLDTDKAKQLGEWRQRKDDISLPYRKEAVEKYLQERWGQKWNDVQKEKRALTRTIQDYNDGKGYGFFDKHITNKYEQDGKELRRQSENLDYREKDLINVMNRERNELINPRNTHAHGKYEVDRMADKIAQERDPQYQAKRETISRIEEKIIAERQAILPEKKLAQELCRNLEKIRDRDRDQYLESIVPREQGRRLSLSEAMKNPEVSKTMGNQLNQLNKGLERHHKTMERSQSRGMER